MKVRASVETVTGLLVHGTLPEALAGAAPPARRWTGVRVPAVVEGSR